MKVSIVVPTRERADTLRHTLRTCVTQDHEELEIIVSDNASEDTTRDVVAEFTDRRIRYIRTPARLSMARNWDFALKHITGDVFTYIGDDDGLLPHAVRDGVRVLEDSSAPALAWLKAEYHWPSYPQPELRNLLAVPLQQSFAWYNGRTAVKEVCGFWLPYTRTPVVYNSFVRTELARQCVGADGRFFHSVTPDVYSGAALASRMAHYIFSTRPFSVNGASNHSNGSNAGKLFDSGKNPVAEFQRENDIPLHRDFPIGYIGSVTAVVTEALLQARDHVYNGDLAIDRKEAVRRVVREMAPRDARLYEAVTGRLGEFCQGTPLESELKRAMARYPSRPVASRGFTPGLSPNRFLTVDASRVGVDNVYDACAFTYNLLGDLPFPVTITKYARYNKLKARLIQKAAALVPDITL